MAPMDLDAWYRDLRARRQPPRAWVDDDAPWADAQFSRDYARTGSLGSGRARREASFLHEQAPEAGQALDLGCGEGRTARALARLGVEVTGVDVGAGAIEMAREKRDQLPCRFEVCDLASGPLPQGEFGLVYAIDGTLAGFRREDVGAILAKAAARLAEGGVLVLELPTEAMAEALDLRQDWYVDDDSLAGRGRQLVLTEDFWLRDEGVYLHRIHCLFLEDGRRRSFTQSYAVYEPPAVRALLADVGLEVVAEHGEFGPDAYAPGESHRLVVVAQTG